MEKKTKYIYTRVLQGNYGYGWEDLISCDKSDRKEVADFKNNVRIYRKEERGTQFRVIERRVLRA